MSTPTASPLATWQGNYKVMGVFHMSHFENSALTESAQVSCAAMCKKSQQKTNFLLSIGMTWFNVEGLRLDESSHHLYPIANSRLEAWPTYILYFYINSFVILQCHQRIIILFCMDEMGFHSWTLNKINSEREMKEHGRSKRKNAINTTSLSCCLLMCVSNILQGSRSFYGGTT